MSISTTPTTRPTGNRLGQMHDVNAPAPVDQQALQYNGTSGHWEAGTITDTAYTVDDTQAPATSTGTIGTLLSWVANRIKAITGGASWVDNPPITLTALAAHKARHATGGEDSLTPADIGAVPSSGGTVSGNLAVTGTLTRGGNTVWDQANDGAGSGLDADTVDGMHPGNGSGTVPISNGTVNTNLNADMVDGVHITGIGRLDSANTWTQTNFFQALVTFQGGIVVASGDLTFSSGGNLSITSGSIGVNGTIDVDHLVVDNSLTFDPSYPTSATASSGSLTLPAQPAGFLNVTIAGSTKRIPYYN